MHTRVLMDLSLIWVWLYICVRATKARGNGGNYEDKLGVKGGSGSVWDYGSNKLIGCVEHSEGGCGTASSQQLTVKNGLLTKISENKFEGHLYSDPEYKIPATSLKIEHGTKIYWTTTATEPKRSWHHQGKIIKAVDSKSMS